MSVKVVGPYSDRDRPGGRSASLIIRDVKVDHGRDGAAAIARALVRAWGLTAIDLDLIAPDAPPAIGALSWADDPPPQGGPPPAAGRPLSADATRALGYVHAYYRARQKKPTLREISENGLYTPYAYDNMRAILDELAAAGWVKLRHGEPIRSPRRYDWGVTQTPPASPPFRSPVDQLAA